MGERSRLVGTDDGGIGHRLARTEDADKRLPGCYSLHCESEGECYSKRETPRTSDDDQSDGDEQDLLKATPFSLAVLQKVKKIRANRQ